MKPAQRITFFERLQKANPHPGSELEYTTPFELLIAVILSAQATDISVNLATRQLYLVANTPEQILALGEEKLISFIARIGLFKSKARHVIATCNILVEKYDSRVPRERAALEALPGVGRKTANVVLNSAFGEPTIAVDTHIFRVGNRTGLAPGKTVEKVEQELLKNVPQQFKLNAHHWLILHGRYTCKARQAMCWNCMVADLCDFNEKTPAPAGA
jgi:endonuclease-3